MLRALRYRTVLPVLIGLTGLPLSAQFTTDNTVGTWSAPDFEIIRGLRTFDVEADGDQDIFLCRYNQSIQGNLSWYENLGQGVFAAPVVLHTADQSFPDVARDFDLADSDGDGDLDLVYVTELSNDILVRTFEAGAFGEPEVWGQTGGSNGLFVRWMQLDPWNDELADVVFHYEVNHPNGALNTGGAFGAPFIIGSGQVGLGPDGMEVGNFTGNFGDIIVQAASRLYRHTQVSDGNGGYEWTTTELFYNSNRWQVLDVDGDGDDDIGLAHEDTTAWLRSPGLYTDLEYEVLTAANATGVFGKVDCDRETDLFTLFFTDFYEPYISYGADNDGLPVIDAPTQATGLPNTGSFPPVLVDLDEDGLNDLLMVVEDTTLHWYANDGPEPPTVTLDPLSDTLVASCEDLYFLSGGLPVGGFYSGPYVGCGFAMGQQEQRGGCYISLPAPAGETTVTYSYSDNNGCYGEATRPILLIDSVFVSPLSVVTCPSDVPVQISTVPASAEWVPEQPITADGLLDVSVPYNYPVGCYFTDVLGCQAFGYTYVNVLTPSFGYAYLDGSENTTLCVNAAPVSVVTSLADGDESVELFDPAASGLGTYTFVGYGDTTINGCAVNDTLFLEVVALPEVTLDAFTDTLVNSCTAVYPLTGGLPAGGIYSGDGVDGDFYPQGLLGDVAITYTYEDGNGCAASATQTIRVIEGISVTPGSVVQCVSEGGVQLSAQPIPEVWFDAIVSPTGLLNTAQPFNGAVYCAWTDVIGCQAYGSVYVNLSAYSEGTVSVAGQDPFPEQICISSAPFTIVRSIGDGSTEDIAFDPAAEGLGAYQFIGVAFDDGNGCLRNDTLNFSVVDAPLVTLQEFPDTLLRTCEESAYTLPEGSPAGGVWSGNGVANGIFSPFALQDPTWLTYSVDLGDGCAGEDSVAFHVIGGVPYFPAVSALYRCVGADPVQFYTEPAGAVWGSPATPGGYVDMLTPFGGFLQYTYTDAAGCSWGASIETIIALPTLGSVNIPADNHEVCVDEPAFTITWSTADGFGEDTTFIPALAGPGTYYFTGQGIIQPGPTQCYQDVTDSVVVFDDTVSLDLGLGTLFTENGPVQLAGGSPDGGTYSGTGVVDGAFDPSLAGFGWHVITYTTDSGACAGQAVDSVFVELGTGLETLAARPALQVWPVPAQDILQVSLSANTGTVDLVLVDARGREVLRNTVPAGLTGRTLTLSTSSIANGTYTLFARGLADTAPARIIIAR